jgi:hypothetical protein
MKCKLSGKFSPFISKLIPESARVGNSILCPKRFELMVMMQKNKKMILFNEIVQI